MARRFPFLILAIGLVTIMGPSLTNATVAIGLGATPTYIRLTRGLVLATQEEDYVQGARALGAGDLRLMRRHVLPNIASALLVQATVSIPAAIIAEAILSFLGLGVQPPTPSWGTMLNTAQQFLETRAVDGLVAGPRDLLAGAVVQSGRRRAARLARPEGLADAEKRPICFVRRPRQPAQRTASTPRRLPSGAASHLDLFEHPARARLRHEIDDVPGGGPRAGSADGGRRMLCVPGAPRTEIDGGIHE